MNGFAATVILGFIKRQVSRFQQPVERCAVVGANRVTDAGTDPRRLAIDCKGGCHRSDNRSRHTLHTTLRGIGQQHGKLIAAQPRQSRMAADSRLHALCRLAQQPVAGGMAKGVVDGLEMVEIDEQQPASAPGTRCPRQIFTQALAEQGTIGEAGKRIIACQFNNSVMAAPRLGDIAADPAIAGELAHGIGFRRSRQRPPSGFTGNSDGDGDIAKAAPRDKCPGQGLHR